MLVLWFWKKRFLSATQAAGWMPFPVVETSNKTLCNIKDGELPKAFKPTQILRRKVQLSVVGLVSSAKQLKNKSSCSGHTKVHIPTCRYRFCGTHLSCRFFCVEHAWDHLWSRYFLLSRTVAMDQPELAVSLSIPESNVFNVWCVVGNFVVLWLIWCYRLTCPLTSNKLKTWKQLSAYEKG